MDTLPIKHYQPVLIISLLLLMTCFSSWANEIKPTMKISVAIETPYTDKIKSLIVASYAQLNFKVAFYHIPPGRSLIMSNDAEIDAELIRVSNIEKQADHLIRVPILLSKGHLMLHCAQTVECDQSILNDSTNVIGVIGGTNITTHFMNNYNASTYNISVIKNLRKMLEKNRLKYIISLNIDGEGDLLGLSQEQYQMVNLAEFEAYHYIHKNHASLLEPLTQVLQQEINHHF